jgi:hypothetical protein
MPSESTPPARPQGPVPIRAVTAIAAGLLFAAALTVPTRADARRLFVPGDHKTIQGAIDAATPGDTVWVAAGVYRGPLVLKKRLLLFGDGGPDSTILDGGDTTRVLHVEDVNGASIIGFGIRGGKAVAGGGIYCLRDTLLSITACTFTKNWESAVAAWECASVNIVDCRFEENLGSAIQWTQTRGVILRNQFVRNRGNRGGAIALDRSEVMLSLRACNFEENRAEGSVGGALMADSSRLVIGECSFVRNSSSVAGGAVAAMDHSHVSVTRSTFRENSAAQAGALHADASQFLVGISLFDRNRSSAGGAAIAVVGRYDANINPIFRGNTFYKNVATGNGATIFAVKSSPEIERNIFVVEGKDQLAVAGVDSSPLYTCNLLHDPPGGALGSLPSADTFVGDPLFCDEANGDFQLRDLSPALRAPCGPIGARKLGCSTFKVQPSR